MNTDTGELKAMEELTQEEKLSRKWVPIPAGELDAIQKMSAFKRKEWARENLDKLESILEENKDLRGRLAKMGRLNEACSTASELLKELCCYSTGVSVLAEERIGELADKFVSLYPEGSDT